MSDINIIPLKGKRIAVVVEHKFIPEEINAYRHGFAALGAEVVFVSRLHYGDYQPTTAPFRSAVDPQDQPAWASPEEVIATEDITEIDLSNYAALLMSANDTSYALRYNMLPPPEAIGPDFDLLAHLRGAPTVRKFAEAMGRKDIVKGFLCHALWILKPNPDLLRGRTVVCNEVIAADIYNYQSKNSDPRIDMSRRVIRDGDIVTGYSKHEVLTYIHAIAEAIIDIKP